MYDIDTEHLHEYLQHQRLVSPTTIYVGPNVGGFLANYFQKRVWFSTDPIRPLVDVLDAGYRFGNGYSLGQVINPRTWPSIFAHFVGRATPGYISQSDLINQSYDSIPDPDKGTALEVVASIFLAHEIGHLQHQQLTGILMSIAGTSLAFLSSMGKILANPETAPVTLAAGAVFSAVSILAGRVIEELLAINFSRDHSASIAEFIQVLPPDYP